MKIIIDMGHPADVHLFRNFYVEMTNKGHQILVTARDKEVVFSLLRAYEMDYVPLGKPYKGLLGKIFGLLVFNMKLLNIARKFKPDVFLGHGSIYASHVAFLMKKPFLTFEDTGNMEQIILYKKFAKAILTPDTFKKNLGQAQVRFRGSKELAYLHPNKFVPNNKILSKLGIRQDEKFVLLRFVGWNASHDVGHKGLSLVNKRKIVAELAKHAKVFISSEIELPEEFKKYQISIRPEEMIDVLYHAELLYGESATMTSECAYLGTPAIFVNDAEISYTIEQEQKFDLVYNFSEESLSQEMSINKALELINIPNLKIIWKAKKTKMLEGQIDLTSLLIWFVENFPKSLEIMKTDPNYQFNFQ